MAAAPRRVSARRRARDEPRATAAAGRARLPGAGARAGGVASAVRRAGARGAAGLRAGRASRRAVRAPRRPAARARARGRPCAAALDGSSSSSGSATGSTSCAAVATRRRGSRRSARRSSGRYELLDAEERKLLAALVGLSRRLDARGGGAGRRTPTSTLLQSLVDKSLVRRWESGRFGMLETIREFAAEQLSDEEQRRAAATAVRLPARAVFEDANLSPARRGRAADRSRAGGAAERRRRALLGDRAPIRSKGCASSS